MSDLRVRDLDAVPATRIALAVAREQIGRGETVTPNVTTVCVAALEDALRALAVAVPALLAMEGDCVLCWGAGHGGLKHPRGETCTLCDGTGSNPARRALDTRIGGEG